MFDLAQLRDRIAYGLASTKDFESVERAEVMAIKSDPELTRYSFISSAEITKAEDGEPDEQKREATWVASDETVDSMGDIIRVAGWDLKRFKANPTLLFAHNSHEPPIGLVPKITKGSASDGRTALMANGVLFELEVSEFADKVWRIMKAGGLPGVSVGFQSGEINDPQDPDERKGLGLGPWGLEFTKGHTLTELSVVPVPANHNAMRERCMKSADAEIGRWLSSGEVSPAFVREFRKGLIISEDQVIEQAKSARRSTVPVEDWQTANKQLATAHATADKAKTDSALLGRTVSSLLDRESELRAENGDLRGQLEESKNKNTELLDIHERLQKTVEQHRKERGDDSQQPPVTGRDESKQQPPSSGRLDFAAMAQAFAASLNPDLEKTDD